MSTFLAHSKQTPDETIDAWTALVRLSLIHI